MRTVRYTNRFKRDYRREKSWRLDAVLMEVVKMLAADIRLPRRFLDHQLSGEWRDYWGCHIRADLVLIYRLPDDGTLELVRLGSQRELGLRTLGTRRRRRRRASKRQRCGEHPSRRVNPSTA
jgi:mRNA interferase YafQ